MKKILLPLALSACVYAPLVAASHDSDGAADNIQTASRPANESVLSFEQARQALLASSPKLASAQAFEQARRLQSEAASNLGGPSVMLEANAARYRVRGDIDIADLKQKAAEHTQAGIKIPGVDPSMLALMNAGAKGMVAGIPDELPYDVKQTGRNVALLAVWPVYNGGAAGAAKDFLKARADEAGVDTSLTANGLNSTLAERYFGAQLARMAAGLHDQAVNTLSRYDYTAKRALEEGLIAKVERLEAQAAFENAKREAEKAHHDAALAATALRRLLGSERAVKPATPIFLHTKPIEPLSHFQQLALGKHPAFGKVNAKKHQAEALHKAGHARYKPNLNLFGAYEIKNKANWVAGVNLHWTLYSQIDRKAMGRASAQQMIQAEKSGEDLRDNILLLVEKHWRNVENARMEYLRRGSNVNLAKEVLRLKKAGLREGMNTVAELMKAETEFTKAKTERAKAANDYVQSLAQLLESSGIPERLPDYERQADVKLFMKNGIVQ